MPTKIDKLFALKAVEKKVSDERKLLEYECRDELLEAYRTDGTDRKTSPLFGPDAGKFSIRRTKGSPEQEVTRYVMDDDESFLSWLEANSADLYPYILANWHDFADYWMANMGEVPDGIERRVEVQPAEPDKLSAQIYSFNADTVIEKLGANFLEGANTLLLGEGE